jgi:hypothetical protein
VNITTVHHWQDFDLVNAQEGPEQRQVCGQGASPPNGHNDFTRAGESQLSSIELFYAEPARARLMIGTPGIPNSADRQVASGLLHFQ